MELPLDNEESLGVGLKPGDAHYRAYVGPSEDYDLIAAMTFNLLTTLVCGNIIHCSTWDAVLFGLDAC
jgi:hypothetical protein